MVGAKLSTISVSGTNDNEPTQSRRLHAISRRYLLRRCYSDAVCSYVLKLGRVTDYQNSLLQGHLCVVDVEVEETAKSGRHAADLTISYRNKTAFDYC